MKVLCALLAASWLAGCTSYEPYSCDHGEDCFQGGVAGICLPSPKSDRSWCAFPDGVCNSGLSYGLLSGDGLARECVAPQPDAGLPVSGEDASIPDAAVPDAALPVDGDVPIDTGPPGCTETGASGTITANHGHDLVVPAADIAAAALERVYSIQGISPHTHSITISTAQFTMLKANEDGFTVQSTSDGSHTHNVTVVCGQ